MVAHRSPGRRDGLTLLEVVFAVVVLSVVLLGVFSAMNSAQRADVLTRERQAASEKASEMLDTLLSGEVPAAGAFLAIPFEVPFNTGRAGARPNLTPAEPFPTDAWTWAGAPVPSPVTQAGIAVARVGVDMTNDGGIDANNANLMEVRVVVAWRSAAWQVGQSDQQLELVGRRIR